MVKQDQLWPDGFRFLFDDGLFQPSTDSFLLGSFPLLRKGLRVCDLGAGTGLLGLLLLAREPSLRVTNVELQAAAVELSRRNTELNGLEERVVNLQGDLREPAQMPAAGCFDLVVSNPPYFDAGRGAVARVHAAAALRRCRTAAALRRQLLRGVPHGAHGGAVCLPAGARPGAEAPAHDTKHGRQRPQAAAFGRQKGRQGGAFRAAAAAAAGRKRR